MDSKSQAQGSTLTQAEHDRVFDGLRRTAIEARANQAHQEWRSHVDSCASCRYFPKGCPTGNRLEDIATKWDVRSEGL